MKAFLAVVILLPAALAQTPPTTPPTPQGMASRMAQLMESTAAAVPDLVHASEPVRGQAGSTIASMKAEPRNAALPYRFINEVNAYLALSDAYVRPGLPEIAGQQLTELREDLSRFQQRFEADLASQAGASTAEAADPNNLHRYADANTKLPPLGTVSRVVFLGDSITDGWHLNEYFPGRDFINRGISGQTTIQMLGRFLQDVVAVHPKVVVVLGGTNDLARGISQQAIEDTLNMIGDLAKAHGIKAVFGSLLPVSDYHKDQDPRYEMTRTRPIALIRQINGWLQEYCRREGFVYLDYFSALADASGQMPADVSDDGLHPNAKGYRIMSPVAMEAVNHALEPIIVPQATPRKRFTFPLGHGMN